MTAVTASAPDHTMNSLPGIPRTGAPAARSPPSSARDPKAMTAVANSVTPPRPVTAYSLTLTFIEAPGPVRTPATANVIAASATSGYSLFTAVMCNSLKTDDVPRIGPHPRGDPDPSLTLRSASWARALSSSMSSAVG